MLNQYNSKTSLFYYKFKRVAEKEIPFSHPRVVIPRTIHDINFLKKPEIRKEEQYKYIDEKLKECHWFDAQVFRIYYLDKHSLNSMAKATQINRNTLYKSIRQVTNFLKNEYKEDEQ